MRTTFATVVTTRPWEPRVVGFARQSGLGAVLGRCSTYQQVVELRTPVVLVGSESSLATESVIRAWKRAGIAVVAIVQGDDPTAPDRCAGADASFPGDAEPHVVLATLASLAPSPPAETRTDWITVTGPRGAPGRSEVAIALAWLAATRSPTTLVDLDLEAPCLGLRLGLPPFRRPGLLKCGPLDVAGFPPAEGPLSESVRVGLLAGLTGTVVVDAGPTLTTASGRPVFVTRADPGGLVRLVRMLDRWRGPQPMLVVNRATRPEAAGRITLEATGINPIATIGDLAESAEPGPLEGMVEALAAVFEFEPRRRLSA
jgi:hypothetical protein